MRLTAGGVLGASEVWASYVPSDLEALGMTSCATFALAKDVRSVRVRRRSAHLLRTADGIADRETSRIKHIAFTQISLIPDGTGASRVPIEAVIVTVGELPPTSGSRFAWLTRDRGLETGEGLRPRHAIELSRGLTFPAFIVFVVGQVIPGFATIFRQPAIFSARHGH